MRRRPDFGLTGEERGGFGSAVLLKAGRLAAERPEQKSLLKSDWQGRVDLASRADRIRRDLVRHTRDDVSHSMKDHPPLSLPLLQHPLQPRPRVGQVLSKRSLANAEDPSVFRA